MDPVKNVVLENMESSYGSKDRVYAGCKCTRERLAREVE